MDGPTVALWITICPKDFTAFADAVAWSLHMAGVRFVIHYLDDFLIFYPPWSGDGESTLSTDLRVLEDLQIPVAVNKLEGPATTITFLGVLIDTQCLELCLPLDRLACVCWLVSEWHHRRSGLRPGFGLLLGHLSQAAIVIRPGQIFHCHLFTVLVRTPRSHWFVHLDLMSMANLAWWSVFL